MGRRSVLLVILWAAAGWGTSHQGQPGAMVTVTTVGIVLPADARPGDAISGSVTLHPEEAEKNVPGLHVIRVDVPLDTGDDGKPTLRGVVVDTGDGPHPADHGLHYRLPPHTVQAVQGLNQLRAILQHTGSIPVVKAIPLDAAPAQVEPMAMAARQAESFSMPPAASAGAIHLIRGPFTGDTSNTAISVGNRSAEILAQTPRATYFKLPAGLSPGPNQVTLSEGDQMVQFTLYVLRLDMSAGNLNLMKGQSTNFQATVTGLGGMPASNWQPGSVRELMDPANLPVMAPGFRPPGSNDAGVVLFTIENGSPGTILLEKGKKQVIVLALTPAMLASGPFTYSDTIRSIRGGGFAVNAKVIPFLAPVAGQPAPGANPAAAAAPAQAAAAQAGPSKLSQAQNLGSALKQAAGQKPAGNGNSPQSAAGAADHPYNYTPERLARDTAIGSQFAPIFYEGMGDHLRSDYITNFDFDGDWRGDNNWDNIDNLKLHILAHVYFSVVETSTQFYVHYAVYHPRDYKGGLKKSVLLESAMKQIKEEYGDPSGLTDSIALSHENDLEGCLVVAEKHGEDPAAATVVYVESMAHNRYIKYYPPSRPAAVGEPIEMRGQHALLFVEPKGHGVEKYTGTDEQLRNCIRGLLIYSYTGHPDDQEATGRREVGYDLLPIYTTMWAHARQNGGVNETFGQAFDYPIFEILCDLLSARNQKIDLAMGALGVAFRGQVAFPNKARPPWGWYDMTERGRPRGEWFFDPADVVKRHFNPAGEFSTAYTFNPYFGVAQ